MCYRGIIIEINEKYCLVLDDYGIVYRIKKKAGVVIGDKIYFLDEDLYDEEIISNVIASDALLKRRTFIRRISAIAASLILCLGVFGIAAYNNIAYATVSMDAGQSIQMELNRRGDIIAIYSYGRKLSAEEMEKYEGHSLEQVWQLFVMENKDFDKPFMVGYAILRGDEKAGSEIVKKLQHNSGNKNVIYLKGTGTDVAEAEEKNISLGEYIGLNIQEDDWEEFLEDNSKDSIEKYLDKNKEHFSKDARDKILKMKDKIDNDMDDFDDDNDEDENKKTPPNKYVDSHKKPIVGDEDVDDDADDDEDVDDDADDDDDDDDDDE